MAECSVFSERKLWPPSLLLIAAAGFVPRFVPRGSLRVAVPSPTPRLNGDEATSTQT